MRPDLRQHYHTATLVKLHLKLPILTTHKIFSKQPLTETQQRLTTHSDRARVNRVHAVGPKPPAFTREPHLAPCRFKQTILRKTAFAIRLAFEEVLTIGNYNLGSRKTRKHFELSLEFPRQPNIVRIQKRDEVSARQTRTGVPRPAHSTLVLKPQQTYAIVKLTFE